MVDLRYGYITNTQFSFAAEDYAEITGQEVVNPKVFAFVAETTDLEEDWDKVITMAWDTSVSIVIIDINYITKEQIDRLIDILKDKGFERNLDSYEDRLCYTCD